MSLYDKASLIMTPSGVKSAKIYSKKPFNANGDFTFDRSTVATRVNKDGLIETVAIDIPRLNYPLIDGVAQDCPSLLLEPARTNFGKYSEQISSWTQSKLTTSDNQTISPDASQNASKTTVTAATGSHPVYVSHINVVTSGANYVMSIFVKKSTTNYIRFSEGYSNYNLIFNFDTEEISTSGNSTIDDLIVEKHLNDWYRLSVKFVADSSLDVQPAIYVRNNSNAEVYTGVDEAVFIWGLQIESGSYPTSYIPNLATGTTTRAAETANGAGTSADFNDSEGVLYAECSLVDDLTTRVITINDSSNQLAERVQIYALGSSIYARVVDGGATQGQVIGTPTLINSNKIAFKYKTNDFALWINGFKVDTSNSGTTASGLNKMMFDAGTGGSPFYGNTKEVAYFKEALTDTELESLSSWDSFSDMATGQEYSIK